MKYEIISLFSGSGGMDVGFQQAGFETVLAIDNCPDAVRTFNLNAGHAVARVADLSTLSPDLFLGMVPKSSRPIGLIGGPPCQGFSRGNVYADASDPRNRLPFRFAELLKAANARFILRFFVFENVVCLTGPKHAERFKSICDCLQSAGFDLHIAILDAARFSVSQRRQRLFVVGLNSALYPNAEFVFPRGEDVRRSVSRAIRGLPFPTLFERGIAAESIRCHPNHWTMMPKSPKFGSLNESTGRSFRRLRWDEISPTVAYGHREIPIHPDGGRRLSVLEAMLLQGFPPDFTITGSLSSQITQVSNAVPPPVGEAIAKAIRDQLFGLTAVDGDSPFICKEGVT